MTLPGVPVPRREDATFSRDLRRMFTRIAGQYSLVDTRNAIHACRRCDGKYWIMVERDWRGKNVVYEWTPGQAGTRE